MAEKGKKEKHEEQVQFAAYKQFCDDTTTEKQRAIKEATAEMERLSASIQKAEADAATLAKEIAGLDEDISVWEGDKKAATEASAYEFQSQGVVDMLEKLHDKFEDERTDLEKEESNARHAFEMLAQDLAAQIEAATDH